MIENSGVRQRAATRRRMQTQGYFWLGMALCLAGICVVVDAGNQLPGHLSGGGLILGGVVIAAFNVRS